MDPDKALRLKHKYLFAASALQPAPSPSYTPAAREIAAPSVIARDRGFWQGGLKLEKGFEPVYNIAESRDGRSVTVGLEIARAG